ncbi:adenosyl-chloride synthase [mine drainage metagenome]|uniref:Adenosyl-chloride synthase n=1 Tax=mine drainage metagenome TaxID=410659 RepID=A0A1J5RFJ7_9ZZZZ
MIYLITDFGSQDIYTGQLRAVLLRHFPSAAIIDLLHAVPDQDVLAGAHLLAALSCSIPEQDAVLLAVVDPGVGGPRRAIVLQADGRWYVGPDNGLLSVVRARARHWRIWEIVWRPPVLSATFHGRDLFAPIAAMLAKGEWWDGALLEVDNLDVELAAGDLLQVVYVDHYGNAMTGIRQGVIAHGAHLGAWGRKIPYAQTFSAVPEGTMFWYENSIGLVEIAGNGCRAAAQLDLKVGLALQVIN